MSSYADVTTIALYDGQSLHTYVRGQNLQDFARDIRAYRLLVTYNGKCFDVPVLRQCLGCRLDQAHIDLRHVLAWYGSARWAQGVRAPVGDDQIRDGRPRWVRRGPALAALRTPAGRA